MKRFMHISNLIALVFVALVLLFAYGLLKYAPATAPEDTHTQQPGTTDATDEPGTTNEPGVTNTDAAAQLKEQQAKIKKLTEVRQKLINEIVAKSSELKLDIDIDMNTGAVRFSESLFFETNSEKINSRGEEYLKKFVTPYLSILLGENGRDYIDQIIIEGHADDGGSFIYNLGLSQRRSFAVASYIFNNGLVKVPGVVAPEKYISIGGRSYSQPVIIGGAVDRDKSRRVEFVFRLKDEELIAKIYDILEGVEEGVEKGVKEGEE